LEELMVLSSWSCRSFLCLLAFLERKMHRTTPRITPTTRRRMANPVPKEAQ
jgi:hypothetical protein